MTLPRNLERWLPAYLKRERPRVTPGATQHLIIAVCDHFEPYHKTDHDGCMARVERWAAQFPKAIAPFRDAGGKRPRHSFFYPVEQYHPEVLDRLTTLCRQSGAEIEIHLHHADDDGPALAEHIEKGKADLRSHGLLAEAPGGGPAFGFIHGDWAIANCHPNGANCGVGDELARLRAAGCYADLTMPSAPHPTQFQRINSIYYADVASAGQGAAAGPAAAAGEPRAGLRDRLLMVQGPLGLNWRRRKWGLVPRIENADLTGANPPTATRLELWSELAPRVAGCPDWVFIKLHTHGALRRNSEMLLGEAMADFHRALGERFNDGERFASHYVSAREMVNLIHAAEDGASGDPEPYRDGWLKPPPCLSQ